MKSRNVRYFIKTSFRIKINKRLPNCHFTNTQVFISSLTSCKTEGNVRGEYVWGRNFQGNMSRENVLHPSYAISFSFLQSLLSSVCTYWWYVYIFSLLATIIITSSPWIVLAYACLFTPTFCRRAIGPRKVGQTGLVFVCDKGLLVNLYIQDDKSLCASVTICVTLVNIQTDRQTQTHTYTHTDSI